MLKEPRGAGRVRAVEQKVMIDNLPQKFKTYLFYFPGPNRTVYADTESSLIQFALDAGGNLLASVILNDHLQFELFSRLFEVKNFPTIVITANSKLASIKSGKVRSTLFSILENKRLLKNPEKTLDSVGKMFNLFLRKDVRGAQKQSKKDQRFATLSHARDVFVGALGKIEVTVSVFKGLLDITAKRRKD